MWYNTVGCILAFALSLLIVPGTTEAQQAGKVWRIGFLTLRPGTEARATHLEFLEVRTPDYVSDTFEAAITAGVAGVLVLSDPFTYSIRQHLADLAVKSRLPTMHAYRE